MLIQRRPVGCCLAVVFAEDVLQHVDALGTGVIPRMIPVLAHEVFGIPVIVVFVTMRVRMVVRVFVIMNVHGSVSMSVETSH